MMLLLIAGIAAIIYMTKDQLKSVFISGEDALNNANVQAFLAMIRKFESAGRYNVIYGGTTFDNFETHPNIRVPFLDPRTGKQNISTAAGAYQITWSTWQTVLKMAGNGDFSPESQDRAAVWLLKMNGSLADIIDGDFTAAIRKASKLWASLPFTDSKQSHVSIEKAYAAYTAAGGVAT